MFVNAAVFGSLPINTFIELSYRYNTLK